MNFDTSGCYLYIGVRPAAARDEGYERRFNEGIDPVLF
jgi:hypothetical protein